MLRESLPRRSNCVPFFRIHPIFLRSGQPIHISYTPPPCDIIHRYYTTLSARNQEFIRFNFICFCRYRKFDYLPPALPNSFALYSGAIAVPADEVIHIEADGRGDRHVEEVFYIGFAVCDFFGKLFFLCHKSSFHKEKPHLC